MTTSEGKVKGEGDLSTFAGFRNHRGTIFFEQFVFNPSTTKTYGKDSNSRGSDSEFY